VLSLLQLAMRLDAKISNAAVPRYGADFIGLSSYVSLADVEVEAAIVRAPSVRVHSTNGGLHWACKWETDIVHLAGRSSPLFRVLCIADGIFTISEVARLLRAVDGRGAFTARAIRYYARAGVMEPTARVPGARGARLYALTGVALLRLLWRPRKWQLSERVTWALFVYRGCGLAGAAVAPRRHQHAWEAVNL